MHEQRQEQRADEGQLKCRRQRQILGDRAQRRGVLALVWVPDTDWSGHGESIDEEWDPEYSSAEGEETGGSRDHDSVRTVQRREGIGDIEVMAKGS
ncbi:hypothetical protein GcM1_187014 [Golovinomyces cichoracearum]|uniref:Uncharacterized protein n=1 Tax=Golovinomyces cichoracearum TaxID=62708 RepID=A0A420J2M1_9PEZI|nr:hypothetical protein GcM1_187014 [Golovinomyces cichoracearum]